MCCFDRNTVEVNSTGIFGGIIDINGCSSQFVGYHNDVTSTDGTPPVMVLPFPTKATDANPTVEDSGIVVVDPKLVDGLDAWRELETQWKYYGARGMPLGSTVNKSRGLVLEDNGTYKYVRVPRMSDLINLPPGAPALTNDFVQLMMRRYNGNEFGCVVCQLKTGKDVKYSPMIVISPLARDGRVFFPTYHAGHEPEYNHVIYGLGLDCDADKVLDAPGVETWFKDLPPVSSYFTRILAPYGKFVPGSRDLVSRTEFDSTFRQNIDVLMAPLTVERAEEIKKSCW